MAGQVGRGGQGVRSSSGRSIIRRVMLEERPGRGRAEKGGEAMSNRGMLLT